MQNSLHITDREKGIMLMLKAGFSNHRISQETGISVNTVKYHLKRIYKKLQAENRIEAINKFETLS